VSTAASWRGIITGAFTSVLSSPSIGRISLVEPLRQGAEALRGARPTSRSLLLALDLLLSLPNMLIVLFR
jgi:hypothetical protein